MLYTRGTSDDYDSIAELVGDERWSWDSLQPFIEKVFYDLIYCSLRTVFYSFLLE